MSSLLLTFFLLWQGLIRQSSLSVNLQSSCLRLWSSRDHRTAPSAPLIFFLIQRGKCSQSPQVQGIWVFKRKFWTSQGSNIPLPLLCLVFLGGYLPSWEARYVSFLVHLPCSCCKNVSFGNRSCCKKNGKSDRISSPQLCKNTNTAVLFLPLKRGDTETRTHSNGWVNPANRVLSLTGKTLQHISYVVHANRESWARWLSQNVFVCGQAWQLMPVIKASGKQRQKEQLVVQGHA